MGGRKQLPAGESHSHYEVFFAVTDCDAATYRATALGGSVLAPPFDTPFGRIAVLADDRGVPFTIEAR
jgi:predicted enzyme related to lactoylglutathione lyase